VVVKVGARVKTGLVVFVRVGTSVSVARGVREAVWVWLGRDRIVWVGTPGLGIVEENSRVLVIIRSDGRVRPALGDGPNISIAGEVTVGLG
jgi:hypothetical protein